MKSNKVGEAARSSDRISRALLWIAISSILVMLIFSVVVGLSIHSDKQALDTGTEYSGRYKANVNLEIARDCSSLSGKARSSCVQDVKYKARENERAEQELAVQKSGLLWSRLSGITSGSAYILSIVNLLILLAALVDSRRANQATQSAMLADLRPWLDIDLTVDHATAFQDGFVVAGEVRVFNFGRTPARNVKLGTVTFPAAPVSGRPDLSKPIVAAETLASAILPNGASTYDELFRADWPGPTHARDPLGGAFPLIGVSAEYQLSDGSDAKTVKWFWVGRDIDGRLEPIRPEMIEGDEEAGEWDEPSFSFSEVRGLAARVEGFGAVT